MLLAVHCSGYSTTEVPSGAGVRVQGASYLSLLYMEPCSLVCSPLASCIETYVLPRLSAADLGRLLCTCRALRDLVSGAHASTWIRAAAEALPQPLKDCVTTHQALHLLSRYGTAKRNLREGMGITPHYELIAESRPFGKLQNMAFSSDGYALAYIAREPNAQSLTADTFLNLYHSASKAISRCKLHVASDPRFDTSLEVCLRWCNSDKQIILAYLSTEEWLEFNVTEVTIQGHTLHSVDRTIHLAELGIEQLQAVHLSPNCQFATIEYDAMPMQQCVSMVALVSLVDDKIIFPLEMILSRSGRCVWHLIGARLAIKSSAGGRAHILIIDCMTNTATFLLSHDDVLRCPRHWAGNVILCWHCKDDSDLAEHDVINSTTGAIMLKSSDPAMRTTLSPNGASHLSSTGVIRSVHEDQATRSLAPLAGHNAPCSNKFFWSPDSLCIASVRINVYVRAAQFVVYDAGSGTRLSTFDCGHLGSPHSVQPLGWAPDCCSMYLLSSNGFTDVPYEVVTEQLRICNFVP